MRHKVDLNESRKLMLVKHLSRCFGKFSGYKFPNSSCVQGGLHGEYFEKFILYYFHSTAEFDITVFFCPPPHLDPRGPITFELVITWGFVPILAIRLNATQYKWTWEDLPDDLVWNMTSKEWGKFVESADRATDIMGYNIRVPALPPTHFAGDQKSLKFTFFYFSN